MKDTSTTVKSKKERKGVAQVAIWKDNPEVLKMQDVFTNYSQEVFYDFSKPLRLLDGPGWHSAIQAQSDEGFFVFTTNQKIY